MSEIIDGLFIVLVSIPFIVLVVRFVYWMVDQGLKDLARTENDPEYRRAMLADLDVRIKAEPEDPSLRRKRADIRRFDDDHAGVVEDLTVYLRGKPRDDAGWQELAESLMELGQPAEALVAITRAVELDPTYTDYCIMRAEVAMAAGEPEQARSALDQAEQVEIATVEKEARRKRPRTVAGHQVPRREVDERIAEYRRKLEGGN